jgi:hypothetical protein
MCLSVHTPCVGVSQRDLYMYFKEPRNRIPAWRNRFFGTDSWAPKMFKNSGSGLRRVGDARQPPFTIFTFTHKVAVYALAERVDTQPVFHLYPIHVNLL